MIPYIVIALVIGIAIGRISKNIAMERAAKMKTVLHWDGELYTVKKLDKGGKTVGS